jgi:hypothetical protein
MRSLQIVLLILLVGVCLTLVSLFYMQPTTCNSSCLKEPCGVTACKPGEQRAGFPFPFVQDNPSQVGSSPTSNWGRIDVEDLLSPDIKAFWSNVLFYSTVVLIIFAFRVSYARR